MTYTILFPLEIVCEVMHYHTVLYCISIVQCLLKHVRTWLPHVCVCALTVKLVVLDCWVYILSYHSIFSSELVSLVSVAAFIRPCESHEWGFGAFQ